MTILFHTVFPTIFNFSIKYYSISRRKEDCGMFRQYYLFETVKIVEKNREKPNCSYGKISHALKSSGRIFHQNFLIIYLRKMIN